MRRSMIFGAAVMIPLSALGALADPIPAPPVLPTPQAYIRFTGGDGSTCRRPIVIEGASREVEGVRAERWWIFTKHAGASIVEQKLSHEDGRDLETIHILAPNGVRRTVCFDITSFFGKP